jgi:DNA-directed RNA polymerase specialized sigma24 family protein
MDDDKGRASSHLLRSAQFEELLRRLDPNRDQAGELYETLRRRLIKFFEWNSCSPAEDLADETLDRVAQKLTVEAIHDLHAFAAGVAKRVRQEAYKQAGRSVQVPDLPNQENFFQDLRNPEQIMQEKVEGQRRSNCLRVCMQRMADQDRALFVTYHTAATERRQHRLEMARESGLTIGTLRVRINRLRDELETCARKCVASSSVGRAGGLRMRR